MSKPATPTFATIGATDLHAVAGGRRASSGSSRAASDDRMMDTLDSIESAIKDLGRTTNQGGDTMSQMMPILALSMMNQRPAAAPQIVCVGGRKRRRC